MRKENQEEVTHGFNQARINNQQSDVTLFQMCAGVGQHRTFVKVINRLLDGSVLCRTLNSNIAGDCVLDVLPKRKICQIFDTWLEKT